MEEKPDSSAQKAIAEMEQAIAQLNAVLDKMRAIGLTASPECEHNTVRATHVIVANKGERSTVRMLNILRQMPNQA